MVGRARTMHKYVHAQNMPWWHNLSLMQWKCRENQPNERNVVIFACKNTRAPSVVNRCTKIAWKPMRRPRQTSVSKKEQLEWDNRNLLTATATASATSTTRHSQYTVPAKCAPMEHGARQKIVKRHSSIVDHCLVFHSVHVVQNAYVWSCARIIPVFFVGSRHFSLFEPFRPTNSYPASFVGCLAYILLLWRPHLFLWPRSIALYEHHRKMGKLHLPFQGNISATRSVHTHRHITPTEIATSEKIERELRSVS